VNCATPIIGDRRLCAACQNKHGEEFLASEIVDDAITTPRPRVRVRVRVRKSLTVWQSLAAWLVIAQLFAIVAILFVLAGKGCS
jgi:hypothetical protein